MTRTHRRHVTSDDRARFFELVATQTGQTLEQVAEQIRQAVDLGWLVETEDGWQAALPADVAPVDWTGPTT